MAEESDLEKTEAATPRRLEKAREEGQVARSRELNTLMLLAGGVAALWFLGAEFYRVLRGVIRSGMAFDVRVGTDVGVMTSQAVNAAWEALVLLFPVFGALVVLAVISSVSLGGLLFSGKALQPKFERLNPLKGVMRLFSAQTLVELLKTIAKAIVIGGIAAVVIWSYQDQMIALMYAPTTQALAAGMRLVALCCALIVAALLLIVLIDVPWQLYSHHKKLRMSRQDVKQEHKESDGDPHVKARIRQQQRAMARRRMMAEVPKADVVVTNPTHYAVALKYEAGGFGAPCVVAKGSGLIAARIRMLAQEHDVPQLSAPPLARALHEHVELGQEIPAELYKAVAEVLAWVFQLRSWKEGLAAEPQHPADLPVPDALDPQANGAT
ncbi:flagellar type III secretion system protein FlhB [Pusillimonas sp. DMV24BSW_D]|uniref:flagellar biosynthesis protein FlhB n=1 Tax=Neopusillimonas aestuarii TaxID=2716226 RepID=UPI00140E3527|nr:flagellar biosynthesis protein FlhB [Pusillimonas sp. DMV24BSW_D]QIM49230.1 flagellar type III secretion system protein FlhB [Pusillimonas sp. DMV24BSW_D]